MHLSPLEMEGGVCALDVLNAKQRELSAPSCWEPNTPEHHFYEGILQLPGGHPIINNHLRSDPGGFASPAASPWERLPRNDAIKSYQSTVVIYTIKDLNQRIAF